jgi:hypothetical protein
MPDIPDEAWGEISDRFAADHTPETLASAICAHCEYVIRLTATGQWRNVRTDAIGCGPQTLHSPKAGTLVEVR